MSILNLGDVAVDSTVYVPFHTFDSNDPSASVTITGLAVTDIEIYKNGSITQRSSDVGYALLDTDGIDFDGITGLHGFSIDLSDDTDTGFFAAGSVYWVAVSAVTVDAATINFWAAIFTIERAGGTATILTDSEAVLADSEATIADTEAVLTDSEAIIADTETGITERATLLTDTEAILGDTNELQTDWTNAGRLDAILDAVLADTETGLTERATLLTDTEAILTDAEAILADTNELQGDWTDAGRLDAILDAVLVDTEAAVTDTEAVLTDTEATIADTEAAAVTLTGVVLAQGTIGATGNDTTHVHLDDLSSYGDGELDGYYLVIYDNSAGEYHVREITSWANTGALATVSTLPFTPEASTDLYRLSAAQAGAASDTSAILVDTEAIIADTESSQTTEAAILTDTEAAITERGTLLTDTEAVLADTEAILTDAEAILADTNELQTDWVDAGRLDAILDAVLVDTEAAITERSTILTDTEAVLADTEGAGAIAAILTDTEAVLSDTEASQTAESAILTDTEAAITERSTLLTDTEAVLADSEASQTAETAILTDTEAAITERSTLLTDTEAILTDAEAVLADTENLGLGIIYGAAATGTLSTTQATTNLTGYADDQLIGRVIIFTSGVCEGEATDITDSANTGGLLTFTALTTAPENGDLLKIV